MTDGTFFRTVTIDEPDFGAAVVTFALVSSVAIADNQEIFPRREYAVTLDADGLGSITLPCADDTGTRAWLWSVTLNGTQFFIMAYGASISLAELLVTSAATEAPASLTALLNAKMDKQPTADTGTVVLYDANGNSALSGVVFAGFTDANTIATGGASQTLSSDYAAHIITLTANCAITLSAPDTEYKRLRLRTIQGTGGGFAVTFTNTVTYDYGIAPVPLTAEANITDYVLETLDTGTTWRLAMIADGVSA